MSPSAFSRASGTDTATIRVHRLSCFVVPLHCTFSPPFPPALLPDPDEDATDGDGGLDDALCRREGVCGEVTAGRGLAGAE